MGVFFLSLVQMKAEWKARSDAHARTVATYAEVKREARYLLAQGDIQEVDWRRVLSRYDMASAIGVAMPEREFLRQKRIHKIKMDLSKTLDEKPAISLTVLKVKLWWRDNVRKLGP